MKIKIPDELFNVKEADPEKVRKKHLSGRKINMKIVISLFAAAVVLLALVSAVVAKSEIEKEKETSVSDSSFSESTISQNSISQYEGDSFNLLLALTKDGNKNLQMLSVLHADIKSGKIKITYIPTTTKTSVNNYEGTMENHLENGGITELLWAVGKYASISIPYYIYCDEENFYNIMKYLGDTEIVLENKISHDYNGINFIIEDGTQKLSADMMLKYFVYLCDNGFYCEKELTSLFSVLGKKLISHDTPESVSKNFDGIINNITTNISAIDIVNNTPLLLDFSKKGSIDNLEIVSSAKEF